MNRESIPQIIEALQKFGEASGSDFRQWIWDLQQADKLWYRCPFAENDRVVLTKTPIIGEASGWRGAKHFLVEGAVALVVSVGFLDGEFKVGLIFDNETYIDHRGQECGVDQKSVYVFRESFVRKLSP